MQRFVKYRKTPYAEMEHRILRFWRDGNVFQTSIQRRPAGKAYVFYDGPPFITGLPHHGTLLSSIIKDVVPRFQTMRGFRVERRWGWDCHGLPAENFVEKKLNLKDKQAVLDHGLEKYVSTCRESMIETGSLWQESIDRIGRWVEFANAYKTMDAGYMESVWWAFKRLYEQDKIYEGEKVLMYCTRCATPVSKFEIAMDNSYQTVTDSSVYVKFKLRPEETAKLIAKINLSATEASEVGDIFFLAWTTTPWTLPANSALAVNKDLDYALIVFGAHCYILASGLVGKVFSDENAQPFNIEPLRIIKGEQLVGLFYQPLFEDLGDQAHRVLAAQYVTTSEGSGVVHLAPAYGEEDYELARQSNLPVVRNIDEHGFYSAGPWQGQSVWKSNEIIVQRLLESEHVLRIVEHQHSYPHCHRCQTRLMYKVHPSWFLNVAEQRSRMLELNDAINWFPEHIKQGRFKAIIESAPDWNISRDRFWATPLPVWRGIDPKTNQPKTIVVGSYAELHELSGQTLDDYHRPWVDEIKFEKDGVLYERIDKVLDCWFESGSMPFAQHHYPFEKEEVLTSNFPADFIVEYVGQVRAWFYYLHVLGVALFDKPAFSNVLVTGTILGADGHKISKSLGNYTDPLELIEKYSADAYRLVLIDSPVLVAEDFLLTDKDIADKQRKLDTLRNSLEFFLLYASADNWRADAQLHRQAPSAPKHILDRWLMARLSQLSQVMSTNLRAYNLPAASKPLLEFIDDLSNWYIRRNRKRFWKSDNDSDKQEAYHSLYFSLWHLAHLIAPLLPFLAEEISLNLAGTEAPSIHLADWPAYSFTDAGLIEDMRRARSYITIGLAQRAAASIKVRQPLARFIITSANENDVQLSQDLQKIILEELNIKALEFRCGTDAGVELDLEVTPELQEEGWVRELVRHIQMLRKNAGLEVENRIDLSLCSKDSALKDAIVRFEDYIKAETLALNLEQGEKVELYEARQEIVLAKDSLVISLRRNLKS